MNKFYSYEYTNFEYIALKNIRAFVAKIDKQPNKMAKVTEINHVTLIVNELEPTAEFYEKEMGLEVIGAFLFDYPTAFFKITDTQQLHLTEWKDEKSFRGHVCFKVDDFNTIFHRT